MKKKRRLWLLLLLLGLLVILGGIWWKQSNQDDPPRGVVSGELLPEVKDAHPLTDQELGAFAQNLVDKSKFNLVIRPTGTVTAETSEGELEIQNPTSNAYPINVQLQAADGQIIYSSGAIEPGFGVTKIHLDERLSLGEHQVVAIFSVYDPDTKKLQGKTTAEVTLAVK